MCSARCRHPSARTTSGTWPVVPSAVRRSPTSPSCRCCSAGSTCPPPRPSRPAARTGSARCSRRCRPRGSRAGPGRRGRRWAGPDRLAVPPEPCLDGPGSAAAARARTHAHKQRRTERRRRRWQTAGAALAAAVLGALALFGVRTAMQPHMDDHAVRRSPTCRSPRPSRSTPTTTARVVRMHCEYREVTSLDDRDWMFKLVAIPKAGKAEEVGTWSAGSRRRVRHGRPHLLKRVRHRPGRDPQSDGKAD